MSLEDITLFPFINALKDLCRYDYNSLCLFNFLVSKKIFNFKILYDYVNAGYPLVNTKQFYTMLEKAFKTLARINSGELEPQTYSFPFNFSDEFRDSIKNTDESTMLGDILITHPIYMSTMPIRTKHIPVDHAKHLLGKISVNGSNALVSMISNVGKAKIDGIVNGISLYEVQLARVISETEPTFEGNLFFKDAEDKTKLISEQIERITRYLIEHGDKFLWGNLTQKAKLQLLSATFTPYYEESKIRDNLVSTIANYVTKQEVENDLVRSRTLDRFIIK